MNYHCCGKPNNRLTPIVYYWDSHMGYIWWFLFHFRCESTIRSSAPGDAQKKVTAAALATIGEVGKLHQLVSYTFPYMYNVYMYVEIDICSMYIVYTYTYIYTHYTLYIHTHVYLSLSVSIYIYTHMRIETCGSWWSDLAGFFGMRRRVGLLQKTAAAMWRAVCPMWRMRQPNVQGASVFCASCFVNGFSKYHWG